MQGYLKLSTAANITVLMVDSTDHITGKTGLSAGLTTYATKAAGTPAVITPTVTELDATNVKGIYKLAFTTSHTDTLGELQLHITATGADPSDIKWQVCTYVPGEAVTLQPGQTVATVTTLTNLPAITSNWLTAAGIAASALNGKGDWNIGKTGYALSSAAVQAIFDALTSALTTVGSIGKLLVDNINATISSRSSHTAADVWASATRTLTAISDSAGITTLLSRITAALGIYTAADVRAAVGLASANLDTQLDALPTNTELATSQAAADDATLAAIALLSIPTANQNADALLDRAAGVETGVTPRQGFRLMLSALVGKLSGAATTTVTIRDVNNTKNRIVATVDADGNRSAVTLDGT